MADMLPLGNGRFVNLDRVESVLIDRPRSDGQPGTVHRVIFHVGENGNRYEDRDIVFHGDSPEGIALRRWAEGLDAPEPRPAARLASLLPPVPAFEGPPDIGPARPCGRREPVDLFTPPADANDAAGSELVALANGWTPAAEAACDAEGGAS